MQASGLGCLTFPEVDLKGQEMSFNVVTHKILQRDQELHCLLQRTLHLIGENTHTLNVSQNQRVINRVNITVKKVTYTFNNVPKSKKISLPWPVCPV